MTDQRDNWTKFYAGNSTMAFPPEGLIRILKGTYPNQKMPKPQPGQLLLDIGCGDGSAIPLYNQLELQHCGTEVSNEIRDSLNCKATELGMRINVFTGLCDRLPFENGTFDYTVAWNSVYYMSLGSGNFEDHVHEIARVLKEDGWLICSIPTPQCFIFDDVEPTERHGYVRIKSEYFDLRQGEIMRLFMTQEEIEESFSPYFTDFSHSRIDIDWFGLKYDWFVFTARRCNSQELSQKSPLSSETTVA